MGIELQRNALPEPEVNAAASAGQGMQAQVNAERMASTPATATAADSARLQQFLGKVTIDQLSEAHGITQGEHIQRAMRDANDGRDQFGKLMKVEKDRPLTRTETFLSNNLLKAISDGDSKSVQDVLGVLSENPGSVDRVMRHIREQMTAKGNRAVNWEQGRDDQGNAFVRMHLRNYNDLGGGTQLTIGSDGTESASYRKYKGGPSQQLSTEEAFSAITGIRKAPVESLNDSGYKKIKQAVAEAQGESTTPTPPPANRNR
jgi:hypothetical protein